MSLPLQKSHSGSDEDKFSSHLAKCRRTTERSLARIRVLRAKSPRSSRRYIRQALSSPALVLPVLVDQVQRALKKKYIKEMPSSAELLAVAAAIDVWATTDERVVMLPKDRLNGKLRWVFSFGIIEQTRSALLAKVAKASWTPLPTQFGTKGGRPALEAWLSELLPQADLVLTTDIPDCFNRIRRTAVEDGLPFPGRVTKAALFSPMDRAKPYLKKPKSNLPETDAIYNHMVDAVAESPPKGNVGVPQGAALAQVASDMLIKDILIAVVASAPGVHAGASGDNLIFILEDASQLAPLKQALTSEVLTRFSDHVISGLTERIAVTAADKPFRFCGGTYRLSHGKLRRTTSEDRLKNYALRFECKLSQAKTQKDILALKVSLLSWASQQGSCFKSKMLTVELAHILGQHKIAADIPPQ